MSSPRAQALVRLLAVQAAWSYERMGGIGVGHAAAPFLRDLYRHHPATERRAAVARSAEYFNSHPYLAGVAVGAVVRAERDGVPGSAITRLRVALSGPLGALGDQLVWAGQVPFLVAATLAAVPWLGGWAVLLAVVVHNALRLRLTAWGLDLGLEHGTGVGTALQRSRLPRLAADAQRAAAFAVGLAIPVAAAWVAGGGAPRVPPPVVPAVALAGAALMLAPGTRTRVTGIRFGLAALGAVIAFLLLGSGR